MNHPNWVVLGVLVVFLMAPVCPPWVQCSATADQRGLHCSLWQSSQVLQLEAACSTGDRDLAASQPHLPDEPPKGPQRSSRGVSMILLFSSHQLNYTAYFATYFVYLVTISTKYPKSAESRKLLSMLALRPACGTLMKGYRWICFMGSSQYLGSPDIMFWLR